MTDQETFEMTLSLNVLEHLGINLYSNVPSVLSEIVANAWDADAERVDIVFDKDEDTITIQDDGTGMTRKEINDRFLRVGYQRRGVQGGLTKGKNRLPMGRKGIGKLSLFSIAGIVEVYTNKDGEKNGFRMNRKEIRDAIQYKEAGTNSYKPEELSTDEMDFGQGTKIILKDLKRKQTIGTNKALRKRIARRFSIIGDNHQFKVFVNAEKITPSDRDYYKKIQFLWTYGDQLEIEKSCENIARESEKRPDSRINNQVITGWLGTVKESAHVRDETDNLNRIAIFVRGKMAQENILGDFSEYGVYASYLIGELRVDGFDEDEKEDAATSNRQHLVEDDERYIELKEFIQKELKHIQSQWGVWRNELGAKRALEIPELSNWINALPNAQRKSAKKWLGRLYRLKTDTPEERNLLLKHSVFAYEFFRATQNLASLEKINDHNLKTVLEIIQELDSLEECLYGQIVSQRIEVIQALKAKVDHDEKEKVIQEYLFDHLWLLDPQWERVESEIFMERRVDRLFDDLKVHDLTDKERKGRLDIKYRKSSGKHIIVELKKPGRIIKITETYEQVGKYLSGMEKILDHQGIEETIEIILVVGNSPEGWENRDKRRRFENTLKEQYFTRIVFYDHLLSNAYGSYKDYFKKKESVNRLQKVIKAIEELK